MNIVELKNVTNIWEDFLNGLDEENKGGKFIR